MRREEKKERRESREERKREEREERKQRRMSGRQEKGKIERKERRERAKQCIAGHSAIAEFITPLDAPPALTDAIHRAVLFAFSINSINISAETMRLFFPLSATSLMSLELGP